MLPTRPQFKESVFWSLHMPSTAVKPVLQVALQILSLHRGEALVTEVMQRVLTLPQLLTSLEVFTHDDPVKEKPESQLYQ